MKAIGIDLGTTNSVIAYCDPGGRTPRVLTSRAGENLTPSVVTIKKSRREGQVPEILVGRAALNYAASAPEDTILSVKRLMGRDLNDKEITGVRSSFNYTVVAGPNEDARAYVRLGGEVKSPVDISAMILRQLVEDASKALGEPVTHAVITVPAYFNESQRAATHEAGRMAGLVVKKIIDEPTAAAMAFGLQSKLGDQHRCLVYDLGGGTFDISILQMLVDKQGLHQYQSLQTEGDNWLGGDDFDRKIVERIRDYVRKEYDVDPSLDKRFLVLAKGAAEAAKRALSSSETADVLIPAALRLPDGLLADVDFQMSRSDFEGLIQEYVDRSIELVLKAVKAQNLSPELISDVLLVGGSTLTPLVQRSIAGVFGEAKIRRTVNPMECVALGAAFLASSLRGVECPKCKAENAEDAAECAKCDASLAAARSVGQSHSLIETTAMALGIAAVKDGKKNAFVAIIPKGTVYPLREPMKQRFQATGGRKIVVPVYEGNDPVASKNKEQGRVEFELPTNIDPNTSVEVAFNYDKDRQVTVTVSIPGTELVKVESLRRDGARTSSDSSRPERGSEETWQDDLDRSIDIVNEFLGTYRNYIETSQQYKIERDLNSARQAGMIADETQGRRMARVLQQHLLSSGISTQLFLADRAIEGQTADTTAKIQAAARAVRTAFDSGDKTGAADRATILKAMVAKAMETRFGLKDIGDQANYEGLLRHL